MIELRLLGQVELVDVDGHSVVDVLVQPKRFALLAYLALADGGFRRRDTVLGLFWPELDESHARGALKQAVVQLRRALSASGDSVIVGRGTGELSVNPRALRTDVAAFTAAIDAGRLDEALEQYRGDLLEGFFSNGASGFDDWLSRERSRLRGMASACAQQLARDAESRSDLGRAVLLAERAVDLSDLDERVSRQLIQLRDRAGDRAGAIRTYEQLAARLVADYQTDPSTETRDLVRRIRSGRTRATPETPAAAREEAYAPQIGPATASDTTPPSPLTTAPRRHVDRVWSIGGGALVVAVIAGILAWQRAEQAPAARVRVAVMTFADLSRDTALAGVGRVAADFLTRSIAQTRALETIPGTTDATTGSSGPNDSAELRQAAQAVGAQFVVTGSVMKSGDSIAVSASIVEPRAQRIILAIGPVLGPASNPLVAIAEVAERIRGSLADADPARRVVFSAHAPKYAAYRAFVAGMRQFQRFRDFEGAARSFERAISLDSTFAAAYAGLTATYVQRAQWDDAQQVLVRADALRGRLSASEELRFEFFRARLRGDNPDQIRILRRLLVADDSSPNDLLRIGRAANQILRPADAIPALRAIDAQMTDVGWQTHVSLLAEAYHEAREYAAELEALRRGRVIYPTNDEYAPRQLAAYAGLRRSEAARALTDTLLAGVEPNGTTEVPDVLSGADEFRSLGDLATAERLTNAVLVWARTRRWTSTPSRRMVFARAFFGLGALDSASRYFESVASAAPSLDAVGYLALIAARRGETSRARAVIDSLAADVPAWDFGRAKYWRAAILAQLGDRQQAVVLLRGASVQGRSMADWHADACLASLRGYPPFDALVKPVM